MNYETEPAVELLAEVVRAHLEPIKRALETTLHAIVGQALQRAFEDLFAPKAAPEAPATADQDGCPSQQPVGTP